MTNFLIPAAIEAALSPSAQVELPYSLRAVRDSLITSTGGWLFWVFLLIPITLLAAALLFWMSRYCRAPSRKVIDDPDGLFEALLKQIDLSGADQQVLREMTAQARLRHPAVCLLSPGLLDWSRDLWLNETGLPSPANEKAAQIDAVSKALFDHVTPSTATRVGQAGKNRVASKK